MQPAVPGGRASRGRVIAWRVTHIDTAGHRNRRVMRACGFARAADLAEALWGPPVYLAVIALRKARELHRGDWA